MANKLEPDEGLVKLVTYTANQLNKAAGYMTTFDSSEVKTILIALMVIRRLDGITRAGTADILHKG